MLVVDYDGDARGARLLTQVPFRAGQSIYTLTGYRTISHPTVHSIQIGLDTHIDRLGDIAHLNHACRPNTLIDTVTLTLTAACAIRAGDELTYFYPSTEWEMSQPFDCLCGAPDCILRVAGARYLSAEVLNRYFINPHILAMKAVRP